MSQHAVFFGIDGAQLSRILALKERGALAELDRFFLREAYTGGEKGTASEQETFSGPGWASLLTGTWADRHGVESNNQRQVKEAAGSLFERIAAGLPGAEIHSNFTWADINTGHFRQEVRSVVDSAHAGGSDAENLRLTLDAIAAGQADFIFNHYDKPDHAGHASGFGSRYDRALIASIDALVSVLDAIEARQAAHPEEDWLLIAATDHGRRGGGYDHGGQSARERQSFILSNKPLQEGSEPVAVTTVATTVLDHLDILFDLGELEGGSILADDDVNDGTGPAPSEILEWAENFEPLASDLRPYRSSRGGADWTANAPDDWTLDDGTTPSGGPAAFEGWTFHRKQSWIEYTGDQKRSDFARGHGVVAVADPDAYDDGTNIDPANFNVFMRTGTIDLSGSSGGHLLLIFDSSFRAAGTQAGVVRASLDGGATFADVFELDSTEITRPRPHLNEHVELVIDADQAETIVLEFAMKDAGNDWWWAIDNIELWTVL